MYVCLLFLFFVIFGGIVLEVTIAFHYRERSSMSSLLNICFCDPLKKVLQVLEECIYSFNWSHCSMLIYQTANLDIIRSIQKEQVY